MFCGKGINRWIEKVYFRKRYSMVCTLFGEDVGKRHFQIRCKKCVLKWEIIEDYPDDFSHPNCLIFGYTINDKIIHIVAGSDGKYIYIITAYFPNTIKFENDLKTRRK